MKCKHRSATWSRWEDGAWVLVGHLSGPPLAAHGRFFKDRLVCDCGEWLPMGEAAPDTDATRIERRAAELAATSIDGDRIEMDDCTNGELSGYLWAVGLTDAQRGPTLDEPQQSAGYLARCIATHDTHGDAP